MEALVLIEHHPPRLVMLSMILRALGYSVLEAGDENEAVHESENHTGPIALGICDARAAGAGDAAFTQRFHSLHPETRFVVLCDSRVMPVTAEVHVVAGHAPINVDDLASSLKELLETPRQPKARTAAAYTDEILTVCLMLFEIT
jgi:response regulator RpfG family c-di-GMP phosphodiesterase